MSATESVCFAVLPRDVTRAIVDEVWDAICTVDPFPAAGTRSEREAWDRRTKKRRNALFAEATARAKANL